QPGDDLGRKDQGCVAERPGSKPGPGWLDHSCVDVGQLLQSYFTVPRDTRIAAGIAASAAGAKERVAQLGAHRQMRDDAAPGPLTPASARSARAPRPRGRKSLVARGTRVGHLCQNG